MDPRAQEILAFWFKNPKQVDDAYLDERQKFWFFKSDVTDEFIRVQFGELLEEACHGGLERWQHEAQARLALIVVLDQFSRNCYRATPSAFSQDKRALDLALGALDNGMLAKVSPIQRLFYLMPLEHSEDLAVQQRCVAIFKGLVDEAEPTQKERFKSFLQYAEAHHDVIAEFGRFPHRNAILGRVNSEKERAYLAKPGAGF